jgi:hypothetical protein
MIDAKKWALARARFDALRKNVPKEVDRSRIDEYHQILDGLQQASGEDLSTFRIPESEVKPRIVGAVPGTRSHPGRLLYGHEECDESFFARQIESLANYLGTIEAPKRETDHTGGPVDYWSINDRELEQLAIKYNIPPISRAGAQGEHWYIDRDRIIAELVKRDVALRAGREAPPSNIVNVGTMHGSSIQQASPGAKAEIHFEANDPKVEKLLDTIVRSLDQITLSESARKQLEADVATLRAQISSPHPKSSIVVECLHSMRAILEGAAGSVIATGIAYEIAKLLGS